MAIVGRWFAGHLLSAGGFALRALSVNVIIGHLRERGHGVPSFITPIMAEDGFLISDIWSSVLGDLRATMEELA